MTTIRFGVLALCLCLWACSDETSESPLTLAGDAGQEPDAVAPDADEADAPEADGADTPDAAEEPCVPTDEPPDGGDLPESWTIQAEDITVEIQRAPFSYTVVNGEGEAVLRSLGDGGGNGFGSVGWTGGSIRWRPGISPGYFGFQPNLDPWREGWVVIAAEEADRRLTLTMQGPDPEAEDCLPLRMRVSLSVRAQALRVEASLSDEVVPRAWAAAFETPEEEGFLGFGERFNRTNQRGVDVYNFAEEGGIGTGEGDEPGPRNPTPNGEAMTNYPVPFFISTQGYGFWLDSTWRSEFNLATEREDAWRVWHIGPDFAFEVYVPIVEDERPWPYHLIERFTDAVGKPMLPPAWTFGPRRRISQNDMQDGVHELQAMRDLDLAITAADDALHILPKATHLSRPGVREWVAFARDLGFRVNCYYNSLVAVDEDSPLHDEYLRAVENGWFIKNAEGNPSEVFLISGELVIVSMVDFTSPDATAWFQETLLSIGPDLGYSGSMYDFGEYVQPTDVGANGMLGEELHNLYPVLYQKAAFDYLESGDRAGDWLTFARSGFTGAWQYTPMVWSGDPAGSFESSDGLPSMIRAGVNLGLSGAPHWGGDIGGFHCFSDGVEAADEELITRWIQQGSMSSNMQDQDACLMGGDGRKASIFTAPAAQAAWKRYARLHTRLFPYLYTQAHAALRTGEPTMRHLFLEHPDEPRLASEDASYYFGPGLLVAPVVERGGTTKRVPLPTGKFLFWDEARILDGGADVVVDAPLERMPLFLREGHLIPMLDPTIDTLSDEDNPEVIGMDDVADVYDVVGFLTTSGTAQASFTLWDAGTLSASWTGTLDTEGLTEVENEDELASCEGCFLRDDLGEGLERVRISMAEGSLEAGGLSLSAQVGRRVRWDLYLSP